ncbi:MAG: potassium channel family protein [Solirubrobacteraceae bacterium]
MTNPPDAGFRRQRFALVMVLSLGTVLLTIATPQADGTRAIALFLQGLALIVAIVAARDHERLRQQTAILLMVALLSACALAGLGVLTDDVRVLASLSIAVATPAVMVRGLVRLLRERGVVLQAVFGALALYLQIGLIFAFAAAGIGSAQGTPFFGGNDPQSISEFVYFSFTTMSTTGYGDLTPATSLGRSLAVLEMLVGQIYLVTVVGLLVGNIGRPRPMAP